MLKTILIIIWSIVCLYCGFRLACWVIVKETLKKCPDTPLKDLFPWLKWRK